MKPDAQLLYFESESDWRAWLDKYGSLETEVWLGLYKKGSVKQGVSYNQAVEQALCFGWIDGLTKRVDDESYKIRFTPRKAQSNWSASNVKRVEHLIKTKKMTSAGIVHVNAAKADGRWIANSAV